MSLEIIKEKKSLLGEPVSELENLSEFDKKQLLIQLRRDKLMTAAKELDSKSKPGKWTDAQVAAYIKQVRREYNKKNKARN
jgi:hypothetical protein